MDELASSRCERIEVADRSDGSMPAADAAGTEIRDTPKCGTMGGGRM
jgi:hypothetical protein